MKAICGAKLHGEEAQQHVVTRLVPQQRKPASTVVYYDCCPFVGHVAVSEKGWWDCPMCGYEHDISMVGA